MVTETAITRCLAEMFIEHCNYFFPDLPETTPTPTKTAPASSVTFTAASPPTSSPTTLQSYTAKSELFSQNLPPTQTPTTATGNASSAKPKKDLPHPLAESALDEGVTVVVDSNVSPKQPYQRNVSGSPGPSDSVKSWSLPRTVPPIPAPRTSSSNNLTPPESPSFSHKTPPSPAPRTRQGTGSSLFGSASSPATNKTFNGAGDTQSGEGWPDVAQNGGDEDTAEHGSTTTSVR